VQGRYDAGRQVLVSDRLQNGASGWWVVTAVRTSAGAWLPVVRGWVPRSDDAAAAPQRVPTGSVRLEGVLQPDDAPAEGQSPASPTSNGPKVLRALDAAELVNLWGTPIYNGFLVLTGEHGSGIKTAAQPERVPPPGAQPTGLAWRNLAYAVQWWVFAAFALVLWWKMVRQDARERAAAPAVGRVENGGMA
jgi:surfeit locus 1 family protein